MDEERKWCVYMHTSPSGKVYIGMTGRKPEKRWKRGKGYDHNSYFMKAINKYGWDNFKHEILFYNLTRNEAEHKEIEMIQLYKSDQREFGYNIESGGKANVVSEETRQKISKANKGKIRSEEARRKLSEAQKGKCNRWGKFGKNKKTLPKKEKKNKPVICVETKVIYTSIADAGKKNFINDRHICECCQQKRKTCGGYHWLYVYDQIKKDGTTTQGAISLGYITEEDIQHGKE